MSEENEKAAIKIRELKKSSYIIWVIIFCFNLIILNEVFRYFTNSPLASSGRSIAFIISMDFLLLVMLSPLLIKDFKAIKKFKSGLK